MPRKFYVLLMLVVVLLAACLPQSEPTVTVAPIPTETATLQPASGQAIETPAPSASVRDFNAARAFEANRKLAVDIGKRVAGTPGGATAADYIASEFDKSGLRVTRQSFPFEGWEDRGTTVQLVAPETKQLEAQAIQYSPGGQVEGEIVNVPGVGNRQDFARVNGRGKIALVKRGTLTFGAKAANAEEAGAAAILIYNTEPQIFMGTLRGRVKIPTIALSGATGDGLLKLLADGTARVRIKSDTGIAQRMLERLDATSAQ